MALFKDTPFCNLLEGIGVFQKEIIGRKRQDVLCSGGTKHLVTRHLPDHLVEAIRKIAAGHRISLEFIVEFLIRSKENPIVKYRIDISSEVKNFFDNLKLPPDQSASWDSKLFKANLEYQSSLKFFNENDAQKRDLESTLERMNSEFSKLSVQLQAAVDSLNKTQEEMDDIIAFTFATMKMRKSFGDVFDSPTINPFLPTIDVLEEQISELKKIIEDLRKRNWELHDEIKQTEMSLRTLNKRLAEADKIRQESLRQHRKVLLNIQRIKLGLTEIA